MSNKGKLKITYIFTYAAIGVLCPLISQYLNSIGFTGTEIGTITAGGTLSAIFASTFWGKKYANSLDGRRIIALICVMAAVMALISVHVDVFIIFVFCYAAMYFFQGPVMSLTDAMILENDEDFAPIRLCGAAGYAIAVFLGAKVGEVTGLYIIFYIYTAAYILAAIAILTVKPSKGPRNSVATGEKQQDQVKFVHLLKEKKAIGLILCGIFLFGTNVANNTYFAFLYREGGGSVAGVGIIFLLMVGSEAPCMGLAPKIAGKIGQERLIGIAMLISVGRFALYSLGPSYVVLLGTFFLQGMVNGVLLVEYLKLLSKVVNYKLIGIAVAAFYSVSSYGGTILCNFFGGIALDAFGPCGVYVLFTVLNIIGAGMYYFMGFHKMEIKK